MPTRAAKRKAAVANPSHTSTKSSPSLAVPAAVVAASGTSSAKSVIASAVLSPQGADQNDGSRASTDSKTGTKLKEGSTASAQRGKRRSESERPRRRGPRKNPMPKRWLNMFERLQKYKKMFGHTRVPQKLEFSRMFGKLGGWVKTQRQAYRFESLRKVCVIVATVLIVCRCLHVTWRHSNRCCSSACSLLAMPTERTKSEKVCSASEPRTNC